MAVTRLMKKYISLDLLEQYSAHELALAFCVGVYVAFSPFIFLQTGMIVVCSWLFGLPLVVVFAAASLFNNPWTIVPLYTTDYFFGHWLLNRVAGGHLLSSNPSWVTWLCQSLEAYVGMKELSFWAFLIGGNVLGLLISAILYPVVRRWLRRYYIDSCGVVS